MDPFIDTYSEADSELIRLRARAEAMAEFAAYVRWPSKRDSRSKRTMLEIRADAARKQADKAERLEAVRVQRWGKWRASKIDRWAVVFDSDKRQRVALEYSDAE